MQSRSRIGFRSEIYKFSALLKIFRYSKTIHKKKQDKNGQRVFRNKTFIQRNAFVETESPVLREKLLRKWNRKYLSLGASHNKK